MLNSTIVFPESHDDRILEAVRALVGNRIVNPVLILDSSKPETHAKAVATGAPAIDSDGQSPLEVADRLVASGDFDGCVAGAASGCAGAGAAATRRRGLPSDRARPGKVCEGKGGLIAGGAHRQGASRQRRYAHR